MKFNLQGNIVDGGRFKCPRCGGSAWGTSAPDHPDWSTATGHCHGNDAHDSRKNFCDFKWYRKDDVKVFVKKIE